MKPFFITVFLCITTILSYSQESIRWNETNQLTWDDFTGRVNDTSSFDAECFAEIRYNYKFNSLTDFEFDVYAKFDKHISWSRKEKQSASLLKHEQMHFNIAALFAQKLKRDFDNFQYNGSFHAQILQLFNKVKLEYQAMQHQYDEETNHSLNNEKQREWEAYLDDEMRKTRLSLQLAQNETRVIEKGK